MGRSAQRDTAPGKFSEPCKCADLSRIALPPVHMHACSSLAHTYTWPACLSSSSPIHACAQVGWVQPGVLSEEVYKGMNKLHKKMLPTMLAGHYVHSKDSNIKTKYLLFHKKHNFDSAYTLSHCHASHY